MTAATELRRARRAAGLTQAELSRRAGTSQATLSAYERGHKQPVVSTFERLLAASGARVRVEPLPARRSAADLERSARLLEDVLALAEQLPFERRRPLRYPRLR